MNKVEKEHITYILVNITFASFEYKKEMFVTKKNLELQNNGFVGGMDLGTKPNKNTMKFCNEWLEILVTECQIDNNFRAHLYNYMKFHADEYDIFMRYIDTLI